ncbi:MAG: 50S ribosomal protein L25 [Chloroflexota bacterium]
MAGIELRAEPRSIVGKKVRFLRREGVVPGNVYGHSASTAIQVGARDLETTIRRAGRTQLVSLAIVGDEPTTVLVKDWQRHPYKGDLLHVDFYRVAMTETLRMDVPIRLVGEAPAVKSANGTVFQTQAAMHVECLPADIPEAIEVDISGLDEIDASIFVRDVAAPSGVTILTGGDEMIVRIMAPTVEEEVLEAPAEAVAEGEATASAEESGEESSE